MPIDSLADDFQHSMHGINQATTKYCRHGVSNQWGLLVDGLSGKRMPFLGFLFQEAPAWSYLTRRQVKHPWQPPDVHHWPAPVGGGRIASLEGIFVAISSFLVSFFGFPQNGPPKRLVSFLVSPQIPSRERPPITAAWRCSRPWMLDCRSWDREGTAAGTPTAHEPKPRLGCWAFWQPWGIGRMFAWLLLGNMLTIFACC